MANCQAGSVSRKDPSVKQEGYQFLSDVSPKDKPWDQHKKDTAYSAWVFNREESPTNFNKKGERMAKCAEQLLFAMGHNDDGEIKWKLENARFCRVRTCPICQWRRSLMWKAKFYDAIPGLAAKHPGARWIFATFTVKNCEIGNLRKTIQGMNTAWDRMRKTQAFKNILGWVRTTEVTRNHKDGTAHPHFHVLMMVKSTYFKGTSYLTTADWAQFWQLSARLDYLPVVDVRGVRNKAGKAATNTDIESLQGAVAETMKYAVKPADLHKNIDWFIEFCIQIHRLRFIASGGVLKEMFKDEDKEEDLLLKDETKAEEENFPLVKFNYQSSSARYARKINHN